VIFLENISNFLYICLSETSIPIVVNKSAFLPLDYRLMTILLFWVIPIPPRLKGCAKSTMHPSPQTLKELPYYDPIITISSSCFISLALCPPKM